MRSERLSGGGFCHAGGVNDIGAGSTKVKDQNVDEPALPVINPWTNQPRVKRFLRLGVGVIFLGYLALGVLSYRHDAKAQTGLPMAGWSVPRIETQNIRALHVLGSAQAQGTATPRRSLPDLKPLAPYDIYTVGSRAAGDLRLKFATTIYNAGQGPLETRGARNPETGQLEVYQYVYEGEKAKRGRPVGTFDYDHRHGHLHFARFAHYELWTVGKGGKLLTRVAENDKVGFCLMDIKDMATAATHLESGLIGRTGGPVYAGCREDIQGISPGWGDEYLALLYEQDLDLTGVPAGRYALLITSNPERQIEEQRYDNNASVSYLTLEDDRIVWSSEAAASGS